MKLHYHYFLLALVTLFTTATNAQMTFGHDEASYYTTESWTQWNSQGGTGFTPWIAYVNGDDPNGDAGHFIGSSVADGFGDVNTDGKAFGMYGYKIDPALGGFREAVTYRYFNNTGASAEPNTGGRTPLVAGQVFSIDLAIARRNGYKGIDLLTTRTERLWNFGMDGDRRYQVNQDDIFENEYIQESVFKIKAFQLTATTYKVTITRGDEVWQSEVYEGTIGGFKIYEGSTTSSSVLNRLYFNNLIVVGCTESTTWNGTAWSNGEPDVARTAIIEGNYTSAGNVAACMLIVRNNAAVNILTGHTLTVVNTVEVVPGASLTIQNNAALVQNNNNVQNSGNITLYKESNPLRRLDYTMWSSPVAGQNLQDFSLQTMANRFYEYKYAQNSTGTWIEGYWAVDAANTAFEAAKGYLIRMPNSSIQSGYNAGTAAAPFTGTFTGTPNNGIINKTLSTDANRFTAVGNPYPSPISLEAFFGANSNILHNSTGLYLWRKHNNAISSSYATVSMAGYAANPSDTTTSTSGLGSFYSGDSSSWVIAPGQGFIVKTAANVNNPVVKFDNSMRRASAASLAFFRQAQGTASKLWLNVTAPDTSAGQALVAYINGATTGLDYALDAARLGDASAVSLYSIAENTKLAIQARPGFTAADVVAMGFSAPTAGQYTISLDHTEGVFTQGQAIYLKDNVEGITRNISDRDYTFTSEAGTFENRFEVVYSTTVLGIDNPALNPETVLVYKSGNAININTGSTLINSVSVYDISGRQLYAKGSINTVEAAVNNLSVAQQVLIVEVTTPKGKVSKRIVY